MDKSKLNLSTALMWALSYNADDLAANRNGELSAWQIGRLRRKRNKKAGVAVIRLITFGVFFYACILSSNVDPLERPESLFFPLVVAGAGILYASFPLSRGFLLHRDANRAKLSVIEGHVQLDIEGTDRYVIRVRSRQFVVDKEVFLAFKNNDPYRLYYVPYSNTLVSAEWLYDGGFFDDEPADDISDGDEASLGGLLSSQR